MPRSSAYTPELAEQICAELSGGKSLASVCREEGMPKRRTVMAWLAEHPEFRTLYGIAVESRADMYAEQIVEIADNDDKVGDSDKINRDRLRIDARKWTSARMNPRKYGDRVLTELTGKDGGPVQFEDMTAEQVERALALLVDQIRGRRKPKDEA